MNTVSSVSSFVETKASGTLPSAPTNLAVAASSIGMTYMTLTFTAPPETVVDYTLKLTQTSPAVVDEAKHVLIRQFKNTTTYQINGLTHNTTYNLDLYANNFVGTSPAGTLSSVKTLYGTATATAPTITTTLLNNSIIGYSTTQLAASRDLSYVFLTQTRSNGTGDIWRSTDGGTTFNVVFSNMDNTYMPSIACSTDGRYVYASGTNVYMSDNYGKSFRSAIFHNAVNSVLSCDESGRYLSVISTQPGGGGRIWWSNNYCATIGSKTGVINNRAGRTTSIDARINTIFYLSDNANAYYYTAPTGLQNLNDISNLVPVIMSASNIPGYIPVVPNSTYSLDLATYAIYTNQGLTATVVKGSGLRTTIAVYDSSYGAFKQIIGPSYVASDNTWRHDWVVTEGSVNFIIAGSSGVSSWSSANPIGTAIYSFDAGQTWYDLSGVYPFTEYIWKGSASVKNNKLYLTLCTFGYAYATKIFRVEFSNIYGEQPTNPTITSVGTTYANISLTNPYGFLSGYNAVATPVYPAAPTYAYAETTFNKTITVDSSGNSQLTGLMPGQTYGINLSTLNNVGTSLPTSDLYVYTSDVSMSNPTIASSTMHNGATLGINGISFIAVPKSKPENVYVAVSNSDDYVVYVYVSNDYGTTFTQTYSNFSANEVLGIVSSDSGQYVFMSINDQYIYRSTDYGQTFSIISSGAGLVESFNLYITCSGSGQYVALVQANYGHVYWSSNYGVSFTKKSSVVSRFGQHVAINVNTSTIYVSGKNSFKYYTAASGLSAITDISAVSFSNTNTSLTYNGTIPTYYPRFITTSRQLTVAVDYVSSPYVLISSTGPSGFASVPGTFTGANTWRWSVVESKLNFILVGSTTANKAFYSTDNGANWIDLSGVAPYTNSGIITAASAVVNDKIYVYLATLDGVVYLSTFTITYAATLPPSAPSGLSVTTGSTSATISFSTPTIPVQNYTITAVATDPSYELTETQTFTSSSGYVMNRLEPATTYTFTLTATNSNGSASSSVSATTKTVSIPANPTFSTLETRQISINKLYSAYIAVPKKNPSYIYLAGRDDEGSKRNFFQKSTDYGRTFTMKRYTDVFPYIINYTNATPNWASVVCSDDGKYVYAGSAQGIFSLYRSDDYGESLYPVFSKNTFENSYFYAVACSSSGQYVAFAGAQKYELAWSSDYGRTFTYKVLPTFDSQRMSIDEYKNTIYIHTNTANILYIRVPAGLSTITDISNYSHTIVDLTAVSGAPYYPNSHFEVNRGIMLLSNLSSRYISRNAPFDLSLNASKTATHSGADGKIMPKANFMMLAGGYYSTNNGNTWIDISNQAPFNIPIPAGFTEYYFPVAPVVRIESTLIDSSLNLYMLHTNGNLYTQTITLSLS